MWVQLCSVQYFEVNGKQTAYHPGDWVSVGKQQAQLWIASGQACIPGGNGTERALIAEGAGVVISGNFEAGKAHLDTYQGRLEMLDGLPLPVYKKTLIWDTSINLRRELVPVGFGLLDTWQLAVPIENYDVLACHIGDEEDRERTKAIIRDLRVPVYSIRQMFVRKCQEVENLFALWNKEKAEGGDERLAFLRAIYMAKPFILALPSTWVDPNAPR